MDFAIASIREYARERYLETGEQRRRQHIVRLARQFHRPLEALSGTTVDPDHVDIGVDDPVLCHARSLV